MKYLLLLLVLLFTAPVAVAQTAPPALAQAALVPPAQTTLALPASPVRYRYCFLVVDDRYFSRPGVLRLFYRSVSDPTDAVLDEATVQIRKAGSLFFALNYLGNLGWECVSVTNVPSETSESRYVYSETRYLLRQLK